MSMMPHCLHLPLDSEHEVTRNGININDFTESKIFLGLRHEWR